ncbi:L-lactate dehydrogenase complex protein LldG [Desulfofundulus luciae]|uniref:L-lactate dehydrogenase complex protein LldG n=1 Tax=Desulfofundulus luciae TaxID=74702 RepID=A0ABU0B0W5_9FIRM|nr:lactate utilization protein [Desulfofundulus luciae]MDQ0286350.1 L-lactate dehydrogenase complex protein LldG [Desulfofundulus luciae]
MALNKELLPDRNRNLEQLYEEFVTRARALGTEVYRVSDLAKARELVVKLVREMGARKVALAESPLVTALDLAAAVAGAGAEVTGGNPRERAGAADLGISSFEMAIAETGTLVQDATEIDQRLVSMLPPAHLAVVSTRRLVGTLMEAIYSLAARGQIPGYLAFISGPSRTADIERVLTIGVHGPGRVVVIFIDEGGCAGE